MGGNIFDVVGYVIFNCLMQFKKGGIEVQLSLVCEWIVFVDGLIYIFKLCKGVKFYIIDYFKLGCDMIVDDVIFIFECMVNKDYLFNKVYLVQFFYVLDVGLESNIELVIKIDDLMVVIKFKQFDFDLLVKIVMLFVLILLKEYIDKLVVEGKVSMINQQFIGMGFFVLCCYEKDVQICYVKYKDYWNVKDVLVDNLIFVIIIDVLVCFQKFKVGECYIMFYLKLQDIVVMKVDFKLKMDMVLGFNIGYLSYNIEKVLLNKVEVCQVLDMVINCKVIIDVVYQGQGQVVFNLFLVLLWFYNNKLKNVVFNFEKVKELLKKVGVVEGIEIILWVMLVQCFYNFNVKLMVEMIQVDWVKVGIKVKIMQYEWGEYFKCLK